MDLTFLVTPVLNFLSKSICANRPTIYGFFNFKTELKKLTKKRQNIEAELYAIENQQEEDGLRNSLKELRYLGYEMDDLYDAINTDQTRNQLNDNQGRIRKRVSVLFSRLNKLIVPARYCGKVKKIKDRLDDINANMEEYKKKNGGGYHDPDSSSAMPTTFIRRVVEERRILEFLLSDQKDKFSFSICGMGGLGKTYLARLIVNEERVRNKFEQILWVRVSRKDSEWKPIFIMILKAIKLELDEKNLAEDSLRIKRLNDILDVSAECPLESFKNIFKVQLNENTLVVLDDLWKMCDNDWSDLRDLLNMTGRNKVLITTRILGVVNELDEELPLKPLSPEESWSLFRKHAKIPEDTPIDQDPLTERIVKKCEGVPELVRALALMYKKKLPLDDLVNKSLGQSETGQVEVNNILQRLKRSYDYLDPHIKSCLVYFAACGHPLDAERIAQMWIAQKFVRPTREDEFEGTANGYWEKLESASFIRDAERNHLHQVIKFQLSPLVRDLALFLSAGEYSVISNSNNAWKSSHAPRHVSILPQDVVDYQLPFHQSEQKLLRTFACRTNTELSDLLFSNFRSLRVMDLKSMEFQCLPDSIQSLMHLRYVNISQNTHITTLPSSIGNLHNLETLRVDNCKKMRALPIEICRLRKLRNLYISCIPLKSLPDMQQFTLLKNLGILNCAELEFPENDMKGLKKLQSLTMVDLPKLFQLPSGLDDAKNSLESLYFEGCSELKTSPEWFGSLKSLKRLSINGCPELRQTCNGIHVKHVTNIWLDGEKYFPGSSNSPSSSSDAPITTHVQGESSNATREDQADNH